MEVHPPSKSWGRRGAKEGRRPGKAQGGQTKGQGRETHPSEFVWLLLKPAVRCSGSTWEGLMRVGRTDPSHRGPMPPTDAGPSGLLPEAKFCDLLKHWANGSVPPHCSHTPGLSPRLPHRQIKPNHHETYPGTTWRALLEVVAIIGRSPR